MRLDNEIKLDYKDVLLKPKRSTLSSRRDVEMTRSFTFRNSGETYECCPIVASNMDGVGTFSMAKVIQDYKMMTTITKTTTIDQWKKAVGEGIKLKYLSVCTGTNKLWTDDAEDYNTMQQVLKSYPDVKFITIDVANGYHTNFSDFIKRVREEYPDKTIIAGNVVTAEMTEEFSAVMECADAANGVGGHIMADGGCNVPGDIAKAFGGGAHFVMLGGMLAGHNESEVEIKNGKREFYGMSSDRAREIHGKRKDGYRGNEGRAVILPDRGPVKETVEDILGGVRSSCTYIGARRLKDIPKCASFVRCNQPLNTVFETYDNNS